MTEQELMDAILNDAMLYAAYSLGRVHGHQRGWVEGQESMEDWYRDNGELSN